MFFEYIANILYATIFRRFSKAVLSVFVVLAGTAVIQFAVTSANGDLTGGWSIDALQLRIGFTRMLYPFFAGLLLCRIGKLKRIDNAFTWCSVLLFIVLALPRFGGPNYFWVNGLYESLVVVLVFPFIVWLGAGGAAGRRWCGCASVCCPGL